MSLLAIALQASEPVSDPLNDACGDQPGTVCRWVFEKTDSHTAAVIVNWLIGKPLKIAVVIAVAWILRWIGRRWVKRVIYRMMNPAPAVVGQLDAIGVNASRLLESRTDDPRRSAHATTVAAVFSSALTVLISTVAFLVILGIIGIDLAPLIAGAGVAGVAVAFGAQTLVRDCINGIFILAEDQYGIGDTVAIGDVQGVIEKISLRSTVLRSGDGTQWHIPNGEVVKVGNLSQVWSVAVVDVILGNDTDLAIARSVIQDAATAVCEDPAHADFVLEAPEVLGVESIAASGVTMRLSVKTRPGKQWVLQRALREAIQAALAQNDVGFSKSKPAPPPPGGTAAEA